MKTYIKICGITDGATAQECINLGADFLGFNFIPESKRYIHQERAKKIVNNIHGTKHIVGIFRNQDLQYVTTIIKMVGLTHVQLHGEESPAYCKYIKIPVIKSFSIQEKDTFEIMFNKMKQYNVTHYMIDRARQGEGKLVSEELAKTLSSTFSLFLAGGLTADNVKNIVTRVTPYAVDVAGGVETNGVKDLKKIKSFIQVLQ